MVGRRDHGEASSFCIEIEKFGRKQPIHQMREQPVSNVVRVLDVKAKNSKRAESDESGCESDFNL